MVLEEAEDAVGFRLVLFEVLAEIGQVGLVVTLLFLGIGELLRDGTIDLAALLEVGEREPAVVQVVDAHVEALRVSFTRIAAVLRMARENLEFRQIPDFVHLGEDFAFLPVHALGLFHIEAATNPGVAVGFDSQAFLFGNHHMPDVFHPAVKIFRGKFLRANNGNSSGEHKKGFVQRSFHLYLPIPK